jgi:hypothetical protein
MKYKFKTKQHVIKIDCNNKLAKLFNILQSIGFSPENCDTDYVRLIGKKYQLTWFKENYAHFYSYTTCYPDKGITPNGWAVTEDYNNASVWIVIDKKNCFNKYKDSEYAINTSKYSLEEIVGIIFKICSINKVVDYNVSNSFYFNYSERVKLLDCPNSGFGTDVQDVKWDGWYRKMNNQVGGYSYLKWKKLNQVKHKQKLYES